MKEKRSIKLRTDMYEDTKFKIIDTMNERDTINYIWTRILTLCGKVNDAEGRLYVTKNMPYTTEILALEFNRTNEQVANAMKVFIDLNMVCIDENGVIKVCNWNKYQGGNKKYNKDDEKQEITLNEQKLEENLEKDKGEKLVSDEKVVSYDKVLENADASQENTEDNKKERNIIDITNKDLVKNKNESNKVSKKDIDVKSKRKAKKKSGNSKGNVTYDNEDDSEDTVYFQDGDYKPEGKRVSLFKYR